MDNSKRVAVYIRVSTSYESQENSIVNQRSYFRNLIKKEADYKLVDIYADEGKSGKTTEQRYELQRLITDCNKGLIDLILVKSISRFARNTVDLLNMVDRLTILGVEVKFDEEGLSTFDSGGKFLLTVLAGLAEQESKSISENIKWSVQKLHSKGLTASHIRALGYGWDSNSKNCYIIEDEAKIVRDIYAWYGDGIPIQKIVEKLNENGLRGIRGAAFTWQTVNRILNNPLYKGKLRIGDRIIQGRHEAIILGDDFFIAKNISTHKENRTHEPKMYCAYCESHMRRLGGHYRAKGRENVHVYRCICCEIKPSIPEDELAYIHRQMWGMNYISLVREKVRKILVDRDFIYIHLVGSNAPYAFAREKRFRGKKVFK